MGDHQPLKILTSVTTEEMMSLGYIGPGDPASVQAGVFEDLMPGADDQLAEIMRLALLDKPEQVVEYVERVTQEEMTL